MPTLRDCLAKAGKLISPAESEALIARAQQYAADGFKPEEAARMSVDASVSEINSQIDAVYKQAGISRTPVVAAAAPTPPAVAPATPPVSAVPSEDKPDPQDVAADFLEMVNFASRDPAYIGAPFKENLPTDLVSLGGTLVKGGKVEGRTETLRFAFVRDNDSGEIHLLPTWSNTRGSVMLRLPGQASGKGTNLGSFVGRKAADKAAPKFTFLASVLLKQPAHSFPTTFTQEEYDAIREQARTQAGEIVASEDALRRVAPTPDTLVEESEQPTTASGITVDLLRQIHEVRAASPDVPLLDIIIANRGLFEQLRDQTTWSPSVTVRQLQDTLKPNETFDAFHQAFDPIGYAPAAVSADVTGAVPESGAVVGEAQAAVQAQASFDPVAELTTIFGGQIPTRIKVVNDTNLPWDGLYVGGEITLNTARLTSPVELRRVLREELVHSIASDPKVAKEFKRLFDAVTDEDLKAALGEGYSEDVSREEAVIDYIERLPEDDGIWIRMWKSVRDAISKTWGIRTLAELFGADFSESDARTVTAYAYRRIFREVNENSKDDPARFSLATYVLRTKEQKQELIARAQKAGVDPSGIAEVEQMSGIQSGLIPAQFVSELSNLIAAKPKTVERSTGELLRPVLDIANLSISPQSIAAMPRGTDEQVRESELAAGTLLSQHLFIKDKNVDFTRQLGEANDDLTKAMAARPDADSKDAEAAFASAMTDTLIEKYDSYLGYTRSIAKQSGNLNLELDALLDKSVQQLTEMRPQNSSISKALSILAANVPGGLTTAADVVQWAVSSNVLTGKASQETIQFMLVGKSLPGIQTVLIPPLAQYDDLPADLLKMKNVIANKRAVEQDIASFKTWFAGPRKPTEVGPLKFAREYYNLRRQKELAADVAARINKDIDSADRRVRSLVEAIGFVERMTVDPEYRESVRIASDYSNALVQRLLATEKTSGRTVFTGPQGGDYKLDLRPNRIADQSTRQEISRLILEIENFSADPASDPLLVRSWQNQKEYLVLYAAVSAYGSPERGGLITGWKIGPLQLNFDPVYWFNRMFGRRLYSAQGLLGKVGSKAALNVMRLFQATDAFTEKIRLANENTSFGVHAGDLLIVQAMKAHGYETDNDAANAAYVRMILEPILSSRQNKLSKPYRVGELIDGDIPVLQEDIDAAFSVKHYSGAIGRYANPPGETGSPTLRANPVQVEREQGDVSYSTKQIGTGDMAVGRTSDDWGLEFTRAWLSNPEPADRLNLLRDETSFKLSVVRRVNERNTLEYFRDSELQPYYDEAARMMASGLLKFDTFDAFVDWMAAKRQADNPATTVQEQRDLVREVVLRDVDEDVASFNTNYLQAETSPTFQSTVPPPLRKFISGRNSFTAPREALFAPSSYYSYSLAGHVRKAQYVSSVRLVFELRQLTGLEDLKTMLQSAKEQLERDIGGLSPTPAGTKRRLGREVKRKLKRVTREMRSRGELLADYQEISDQLKAFDALYSELARVTDAEHPGMNHSVLEFGKHIGSLLSSSLLSRPQPITTNMVGGMTFTPVIVHLLQGNLLKAFASPVWNTAKLAKLAIGWVASAVKSNPQLSSIWNRNPQQWGVIATGVAQLAEYYNAAYAHALNAGGAAAYNVKDRMKLLWELRRHGGRLDFREPSRAVKVIDAATRIGATITPFPYLISALKIAIPRLPDQLVNTTNVDGAMRQLTLLKSYALSAWSSRESIYGASYDDLSNARNLLEPEELGLPSIKAAEQLRLMFTSAGQLDQLMLNYYKRTKAMTAEDRANEPLINDPGAESAYVLEFLKATNLGTQGNRAPVFRGGTARQLIWQFWSYPNWLAEKLSVLFQQHSKDPEGKAVALGIATLFTALVMAVIAGIMAREPGQELTELISGKATGQLRLENVLTGELDAIDLARYMIVSSANIIPYFGEVANRSIGGIASKPVLDLTAMIPAASLANDAFNTLIKIKTSGDAVYPASDFAKRWFPPLEPIINRLPAFAGDLEQRNAQAALRAVAPSDMEVKQGFGSAVPRLTPTSPIIRDLVAAAYLGDTDAVRAKFAEAVAEKQRQGVPDPERAVWATVEAQLPSRKVFGRLPSAGEEARLLSRMTDSQRGNYDRSKSAFGIISDVAGQQISFIDDREPTATTLRPRLGLSRSRLGRRRSLSGLGTRRIGSRRGRLARSRTGRRRRVGFGSRRRSLIA